MVLLNPRESQPLIKLGDVLCLQGQYRNASGIFMKAVSLSPNEATPYYHLANAQYMMCQYNDAILNYKKSLELVSINAINDKVY